jgi:MscS family membrane protein
VWVVLALVVGAWCGSRADAAQAPADSARELDSPRATMFEFLEAIYAVRGGDESAWRRVEACFDLEGAGVDVEGGEAREIAHDLWSALNHIRLVQRSDLPDAAASVGLSRFRYFPRLFDSEDEKLCVRAGLETERIELARGRDGLWRFSAATVESAAALNRALSKLELVVDPDQLLRHGESLVRRWVPASLRRVVFLELETWQWIGLVVVVLLGMLVDFLARPGLASLLRLLLRRHQNVVAVDTQAAFVRASGLLAAGVVWTVLLRSLALPNGVEMVLLAASRTFAILAGAWCGWRLADLICEALMHAASKTASKFDDVIVPLVRKSAKILVAVLGLIYAAQSLRIDVLPLITGLGIGGLAFAFAAKDTIENFFGSIAVVLDRPFEVGDWVVIDKVEGTVEELGFRSTRVRTFYNSQITVPNSTLVRATVDNYGRRRYRRWKTTLGVQYDTTPEQLIAFTEGIRELVRTHPYTRRDYFQVWCNDFGASSLDILLYIFFEAPDWSTELRERERMFVDIVRLADRLGVQFAFPTHTVHLYQEEHAPSQARHEPPAANSERRAMVRGIRAARELVAQQPWREKRPDGVMFSSSPSDLDESDSNDPTRTTEDTRAS